MTADLDEPIVAGGYEWATYAKTSELTGVPEGTLRQWVFRGYVTVHWTSRGPWLRLDQAQERERRWRTEKNRKTELSDPLAMVPGMPTLPC